MPLKVAQIWDSYMANSFVEVHPLFAQLKSPVKSLTIVRTLWNNGDSPPDTVCYHRHLPQEDLLANSFLFKVRGYLDRRFLRSSFLGFARRKLDEFGADLVHFNFGFTAAQYPELAQGRPFVVTFYGSDVSSGVKSPYWRARYQQILPRASALLVLCEEARERLIALGCAPERVIVWNLPAGVEKYPYREPPAYGARPVRFLTTARFVEKKGHGLLLEAMSLLEKRGVDFSATLLGYSKGITWVREEIERRKLTSRVQVIDTQFRGDFTSLHNSILKDQDFFVMPSIVAKNGDDEGGPALSMVYAQSAGLPVVSTRFPGSEITMKDGLTGYLVQEPDPESLAAAVERMVSSQSRWRMMGMEGRALAQRHFGEREQVGKLVDIYNSIVIK